MQPTLREFLSAGERAGSRYSLGVPRNAPVGTTGATVGARAGASLEFKDHRSYEPGDDLRHIDWNAYARSDSLTVKLFREEVTPHLDIVLDTSRSMALEGSPKAGAATALAAFFATAAGRGSHSHNVWLLGETCTPLPMGNKVPGLWSGLEYRHQGGPPTSLPAWRARASRVLITDTLWLGEPNVLVRPFADRASQSVVIQLLARSDVEPPEGKSVRLVDAETDEIREIHVDAVVARRYREALSRHQENWNLACRQAGATFVTLVAEDVLRTWAMDELVAAEFLRVG